MGSQAAFAAYGWLGAVAYAAFFAANHLSDLWAAHLYTDLMARLELDDPVAPPTRVNTWLLFIVAIWSVAIFIVWLWARTAPYGAAAYWFLVGWLSVPELPAAVRHMRNVLVLKGVFRGSASDSDGSVPTAERVGLRRESFELLVSSVVCLVLWLALHEWLLIGGAIGCLLEAGQLWDRADRVRAV